MNTDNQQEIGLVAGTAWLAGIMDGEGSINLLVFRHSKKRGAGFRLQMRSTIANTNEGVIECVSSVLHQLGVAHYIRTQASICKRIKTGRTLRFADVSTKAALHRMLTALLPYLAETDKIERAKLLIAFIEQRDAEAKRLGIVAKHCYTQADVDLIIKFLRLTRSKQVDRLAEFLNDCTREARGTKTKKSRARSHDTVWPHARA